MHLRLFLIHISLFLCISAAAKNVPAEDLSTFRQNQPIADFRVANLYTDSGGKVMAAKFWHVVSGSPVYVLQIETAPQTFMWVDTPATSNRGVAHSLEHLLVRKGTKGRYLSLLRAMRYSQSAAATYQDYNFYCLTSGTGITGFMEQFRALLNALYEPDFTDVEAEREFYHLGITTDRRTKEKRLVEQGTVYNEMQTGQGIFLYYFELNRRVLGNTNPFSFNIGGVPDEMRGVTPAEIRAFHAKHYRLGQGTGFIFVLPPKESVTGFLAKISEEFRRLPIERTSNPIPASARTEPKYAFAPSANKEIEIFPFPSSNAADRGEIRLGWAPVKAGSQLDLRFLQLFIKALGDGEQSLLYKSLVDSTSRELNSDATGIEAEVFLQNSPWFPVPFIAVRGIPGNHMNTETIENFRQHIAAKIRLISGYQDNSTELRSFNRLVSAYARAWQRDESVWIKSAPLFSSEYRTDWKEHLEYLEMDGAFVRSLSDNSVWQEVEAELKSGKNVWRDVIQKARLSETPYAAASLPSPQQLIEIERQRQARLQGKIQQLEQLYRVPNEQAALNRYYESEQKKTRDIDEIEARVKQPRFADHPPLTPDDEIQYKQFRLSGVPVVAVLFDGTPTIDIGFSFDLRKIPPKYYKYLPILPRSFDSVGLKSLRETTPYPELIADTQRSLSDFSIKYSSNPISARADLAIRASTTSPDELRTALSLIGKMMLFSDLDLSNVDRLRDLLNQRLAEDDRFGKSDDSSWFWNVSDAFRHQDNPLYMSLNSHFTQAHWDERLKWLLHPQVNSREAEDLHRFAEGFLISCDGLPAKDVSDRLAQLHVEGLEKELVQYWRKNIAFFPKNQLLKGLRQLTEEVQEDLKIGPAETLNELRELQAMVVDKGSLKVDITVDPVLVEKVNSALTKFLETIPSGTGSAQVVRIKPVLSTGEFPITKRIEARSGISGDNFPWYVALEDSHSTTAGVAFSADFIDYSQLNRESLLEMLSTKFVSGTGPHTFYMKTVESGLAYSNSIRSDPGAKLLSYYADRVPDIESLIELVNSFANTISTLHDPLLLDYAMQRSFPFPRTMGTFAERGKGLAEDIYDGNEPEKVRRFSEAILKLRQDRGLFSEMTKSVLPSIAPVLFKPEFRTVQRSKRSIFLFVGPERLLIDAEQRLPIPRLLHMYACDFWMN